MEKITTAPFDKNPFSVFENGLFLSVDDSTEEQDFALFGDPEKVSFHLYKMMCRHNLLALIVSEAINAYENPKENEES